MRYILVNETNNSLKYVYFYLVMIDGKSPAIGLGGEQPDIQINNGGFQTTDIGPFEELGLGNYRALLSNNAVSTVGSVLLAHYASDTVLDFNAELITIVATLIETTIFQVSSITKFVTYASMDEAENYFASRLNTAEWDNALLSDKIKSLAMATRDIDNLAFKGIKTDINQPLEFPRTYASLSITATDEFLTERGDLEKFNQLKNINSSLSTIPVNVKRACCEIAIKYLEGINIEDEMANINIEEAKFANVSEIFSKTAVNEAYRAGINSLVAWNLLKPLLIDPFEIKMIRNS